MVKKLNKFILFFMIFNLILFFNINDVKASQVLGSFPSTVITGGNITRDDSTRDFYLTCPNNLKVTFKVSAYSTNNISTDKANKDKNGELVSGRILNAGNNKKLEKETIKLNKNGIFNTTTYIAQAASHKTNDKITISAGDCEGTIQLNQSGINLGTGKVDQTYAQINFSLAVDNPDMLEGTLKINFDTIYSHGKNGNEEGDSGGHYGFDLPFDISEKVNDTINNGGDLEDTYEKNSSVVGATNNYYMPGTTNGDGVKINASQKLECDDSLREFIKKYWKYFVIAAPILLMVMITIDFLKAVFSSDQDIIKKASNNALKRVIATMLLLFLPLIISTILGFFGLDLCI